MPLAEPYISPSARQLDIEALDAWKQATGFRKDQKASELLQQLNGPIMTAVNAYRAAPLPLAILEIEAKHIALEAAADYDRTSSMSLSSYIITMVKNRLSRYVNTHQNAARIPENISRHIGPIRQAEAELSSRFGRDPTVDEIADHLGISMKQVTKTITQTRRDLFETGLEELQVYESDPNYERIMLAYVSLAPDEKLVFDYSMGAHGKPHLKAQDIAAKLNVSPGRVSQLKEQVALKLKPYMV